MGLFKGIRRLFRGNERPRIVTPEQRVFERNLGKISTARDGLLFLAAQKDNAAVAGQLNAAANHLIEEMAEIPKMALDERIRKTRELLTYVEDLKRKSGLAIIADD